MFRRAVLVPLTALAAWVCAAEAASAQLLPVDAVTVEEEARLVGPDPFPIAQLGYGVALDGDRVAASTLGYDDVGAEGAIHVFEREGDGWVQTARVQAPGVDPYEQQYFVIDLDGDTLLGAGTSQGVHVFQLRGSTWVEQAVFGYPPGEGFGWCVSLSGDTAVVGASFADDDAGAVYVFRRSGTTWSQEARLTASDASPGDRFGLAVSIDGERLAVGAPHGDGAEPDTGVAYVFDRTGTVWSENARLFNPYGRGSPSDELGWAVSAQGDSVVAGAPACDKHGPNAGAAYVFREEATGWVLEAELYPLAPSPAAVYGEYVALHGDRLAVVAPQQAVGNSFAERGEAYLLERVGHVWHQRAVLTASGDSSNGLGSAVDIDERHVLLGDPSNDAGGIEAGAALLYGHRTMPRTYGAGKPSSLDCTPFLEVVGRARVAGDGAFHVLARDALPAEPGFLLYGGAALDRPFHGGTLCVKPPLTRWAAGPAAASGPLPCSGELSLEFNARLRSGADPALTAGCTVHAQWIQRDPADPAGFGDSLTDAVAFLVLP